MEKETSLENNTRSSGGHVEELRRPYDIGGKQWKDNKCSEERKILWIDNGREMICVSQSNRKLVMPTKPLLFDKNAMQCNAMQCIQCNAMYTMDTH